MLSGENNTPTLNLNVSRISTNNMNTTCRPTTTFALIFLILRLRFYICAQKSVIFANSFGVTFACIFSLLFLGQLLEFYYIQEP